VRLEIADLNDLETAVRRNSLPETSGFFFGESMPEDKLDDIKFIMKARQAIADGKAVFYTSWW
jgi:hypothetical protein